MARLFALLSPFAGNDTAWMYVSEDKQEAIVFYFRVLAEASAPLITLKFGGISGRYSVSNGGI